MLVKYARVSVNKMMTTLKSIKCLICEYKQVRFAVRACGLFGRV